MELVFTPSEKLAKPHSQLTRPALRFDNDKFEVPMLAYVYVLIAVAIRLFSALGYIGTMGFVPLEASMLFFGSRMKSRHFLIAVALLIGTDVYLTMWRYGMPLKWDQGIIWAWYFGVFFLGSVLKGRVRPLPVAGVAIGSALSFFLVSDFAVWLEGSLYPHTLAGLSAAYVAAIPFFEKGIVSNLVFSAILFGLPALYARLSDQAAQNKAAA